ncbi:MAG: hypothetical protein ACOYYS_07385 [Chloroflexota bacterium]
MNVYLGLFFIALSAFSLEITLVRILSVTSWYYLAFFSISTAMLGMTAGATNVFLNPQKFDAENLAKSLWNLCIYFAISMSASLLVLCLIPLALRPNAMSLFAVLITTIACAVPFYFSGSIISAVMTKHDLPMGKLYASDLIGASVGCLSVLGGMELLDAPSLVLFYSGVGAVAAVCFGWKSLPARLRYSGSALVLFFFVASFANSLTPQGIRPLLIKGRLEPANEYFLERWNSFSRVVVYGERVGAPQYWGPSERAPWGPVRQYDMNIDGEAGSTLRRFNAMEDIEHLRYDVVNMAYYLNRGGKALVIGVGGGRDIQSAILFGHEQVVGVEINPILVDLLENDFAEFAGLSEHPGVTLVVAEARSYLLQNPEKYAVIQMSLVDTWAATGAGAFSLSENSLYTLEAWELFLQRLEENGVFTVSRWYSANQVDESGRTVSLAVAALLNQGVQDPSRHIAVITVGDDRETTYDLSTLLVSRRPFTQEDVAKLVAVSEELKFDVVLLPGHPSADPVLNKIVSAKTRADLSAAIENVALNYEPPTYESPYFFNMLRLDNLGIMAKSTNGVIRGNLIATLMLLGLVLNLALLSIYTVVRPLAIRTSMGFKSTVPTRTLWSGALYFSLIGAGFMLAEIALIQKLTVLLSHPMYALGILLFTLIASAGVGSLLSDRLPLTRPPGAYVYPILTALSILALSFFLKALLPAMVAAPFLVKVLVSVAVTFPIGLMMGLFFPTGMRLTKSIAREETPWYWALNGIFGVFCSALAVLISIYAGISVNFYIAAACYAAVVVAQVGLQRAKSGASGS